MFSFIRRFADKHLKQELDDARTELEAERRNLRVANAEIESMAAVIARDRARVYAETAEFASRVASAGRE
jgi:hypothetical protein